ncbi:MAG TPA: hypothetical protein VF666_17865 [Pyrinomonadaceae bacterium]|jgi:hypothetical protein
MLLQIERRYNRFPFIISTLIVVAASSAIVVSSARASASVQKNANSKTTANKTAEASKTTSAAVGEVDEPPFREYKGVRLGMSADEARKKLGDPADKSDAQDFYAFSDQETAQVFYDASKKVSALAIVFVGKQANAPTAKTVLGMDVEAKDDGSVHRLERFPKAGYWISYSRTAGDSPLVTITMQKMP